MAEIIWPNSQLAIAVWIQEPAIKTLTVSQANGTPARRADHRTGQELPHIGAVTVTAKNHCGYWERC